MFLPVFSPDGKLIAARNAQELRMWDTATGALLHTWPAPALSRAAFSSVMEAPHAFGAGGRHLIAAGEEEVRRWSVETGKLEGTLGLK